MPDLRYEDLTYKLNGWIYQVRRDMKTGWSEAEYHKALLMFLRSLDVQVQSKPQKTITHRGTKVHTFECDLLVWDLIVLELKVLLSSEFAPAHLVQIIGYLKCWQKGLGVLVNFGPTKVITKRVIWNEASLEPDENYQSISSRMSQCDRVTLRAVRQCLLSIGHQYGVGYPGTMYRKIIEIELVHLGIACQPNMGIPCIWQGQSLGTHMSEYLLVDGQYLLYVQALLDRPTKRDYAQMKTYLNALNLQFGLIVNFGKQRLQIYGINTL